MKNTYWNHHGKYQAQVNEIEQLLPSYGYTYNRNMNLFIYALRLLPCGYYGAWKGR